MKRSTLECATFQFKISLRVHLKLNAVQILPLFTEMYLKVDYFDISIVQKISEPTLIVQFYSIYLEFCRSQFFGQEIL